MRLRINVEFTDLEKTLKGTSQHVNKGKIEIQLKNLANARKVLLLILSGRNLTIREKSRFFNQKIGGLNKS